MRIKKTKYGRIILSLVEELYEHEVRDTQMEKLMIGEGRDYADKQDWIDSKLDIYSEESE